MKQCRKMSNKRFLTRVYLIQTIYQFWNSIQQRTINYENVSVNF